MIHPLRLNSPFVRCSLAELPETEPPAGTGTFGSYRLDCLISRSAMGHVYDAHHVTLGHRVALKLLPEDHADCPEILESFRKEARILAQVKHRNVVRVLDFDENEPCPFLVLEYLQGETLADRILRSGPLGQEEALRIVSEVAAALEDVHARGFVHCDLKPANVFLVPDRHGPDSVKLLDFGISMELHREPMEEEEEPAPLSPRGTPDYMSPEQAWGPAMVDQRADQFSLAVMAYELLTGTRACPDTASRTLLTLMADRIASISAAARWLPAGIDAVLRRATSFRPSDRYDDICSFAQALATAAHEAEASSEHPASAPDSGVRWLAKADADERDADAGCSLCA